MDTFERSSLEADMRTLAAEIRSQRERPHMKDAGEKELIKEALSVFPNFQKGQDQAPSPANPTQSSDDNPASPLPAYAQHASPEVKLEIEYLIDIALRKGVSTAFAEAKKSPDFVQDAFHDALTGRLYEELKKEGAVG